MAKKKQYIHAPECAFCSNTADSEEHYLGQWLEKIFPRNHKDYHYNARSNFRTEPGIVSKKVSELRKNKNGSVITVRKKIVCRSCNSGWMSRIQDDAIPVLTTLIKDEAGVITEADRLLIARWLTMVSMTFEFDDPPNQAIPKAVRVEFKNSLTPPSRGWFILAGVHVGQEWLQRIYHIGYNTPNPDTPHLVELHSQTTTLGLGYFDAQVFSTVADGIGRFRKINLMDFPIAAIGQDFGMVQIWPMVHGDVEWKKLAIKGDAAMDALNLSIQDALDWNNTNNPEILGLIDGHPAD